VSELTSSEIARKFLNGEFGVFDNRTGSIPTPDACDFLGVTGTKSTSLRSMRSERGFGYECVDGFVGEREGGVFGAVGGVFA
jgi:hypothetical protein